MDDTTLKAQEECAILLNEECSEYKKKYQK